MLRSGIKQWWMIAAVSALAGCAGGPASGPDGPPTGSHPDMSTVPDAVPRPLPRSTLGNPPSYTVLGETYYVLKSAAGYDRTGIASWYGTKFQGRSTSSGEPYNMYAMTAASKTLPIPCFVRVTNLNNGRQVIVKVNDRGPFHRGRIIDLSYAAASKLGMLQRGSTRVRVVTIDPNPPLQVAQSADQPPPPTAPAPQPPLRPTIENGDYLQAGAFQGRANAYILARQLRDAGIGSVFVLPPQGSGQRFYRVRVGPFGDAAALAAARGRLKALDIGFREIAGNEE